MNTNESPQEQAAQPGGLPAASGYVAALEDALAAAIVSLYSTDRDDCLRAFHLDELEGALERTQAITAETRLEDVYAKALRYPRPHTDLAHLTAEKGTENDK
jgi:hypothetical protein